MLAHEAAASAGWFLEHAFLIPVIPAIGFFVIILFGKKLPMKGSEVGLISMIAGLVLAAGVTYQWIQAVGDSHGEELEPVIRSWVWWQSGGHQFTLGQHIDGLAVMLLLLVTFISTLVQIYSLEYVRGDRRYTHFFASLTLFSAGMLTMVLAENMVQLILGWEIMGLCSFMLIGHWWEEEANSRAALKAFYTVRVGDIGLLVGTAILFGASGTFSIAGLNEWATSGEPSHTVLLWASVALFIACIGKSGQFPLHTWLPDAMAGPTPVSSLLHSSTMVVAGVFLVARLYPVFHTGLDIGVAGQHVNLIAVIGGITILIAAALAFVQDDIKKVLAYSTVSQLGYMMMGLGVGAWVPAVFHIFTHAFFKCCLFLCAGSVAHTGSHHSFDMKKDMGGLRKKMPITFVAWILSTAALCGVPLFSGFFSKDEIIDGAKHNDYKVFFVVGLIGAFMTTAYMTRATYLTFFGSARGGAAGHHGDEHGEEHEMEVADPATDAHGVPVLAHDSGHDTHVAGVHALAGAHAASAGHGVSSGGEADASHAAQKGFIFATESPLLLVGPLIILGFLAVVSGYLNAAPFHIEKFHHWIESSIGVEVPEAAEFTWVNALPSIVLVALGFVISLALCKAVFSDAPSRLKGLTQRSRLLGAGHRFLVNKYYLDALYENVIVRGVAHPISKAAYWVNQNVIDGIVNGAGKGGKRTGEWIYTHIDQQAIDGAVDGSGAMARGTGGALRPLQSGKVNQYGALLFGAAAVAALVLVIVNT
jgi:NADH-quinone oxidoreductase subunit L